MDSAVASHFASVILPYTCEFSFSVCPDAKLRLDTNGVLTFDTLFCRTYALKLGSEPLQCSPWIAAAEMVWIVA